MFGSDIPEMPQDPNRWRQKCAPLSPTNFGGGNRQQTATTMVEHALARTATQGGVQVLREFNFYDLFVLSFVQLCVSTVLVLSPAREIEQPLSMDGIEDHRGSPGALGAATISAFSCFVTRRCGVYRSAVSRRLPTCSTSSRSSSSSSVRTATSWAKSSMPPTAAAGSPSLPSPALSPRRPHLNCRGTNVVAADPPRSRGVPGLDSNVNYVE